MSGEGLGLPAGEQAALTRRAVIDHLLEEGLTQVETDEDVTEAVVTFGESAISAESLEEMERCISLVAEEYEITYLEAARLFAETALSNRELIGTISRDLG